MRGSRWTIPVLAVMSFCSMWSLTQRPCTNSSTKHSSGDPWPPETDGPTRSALAPKPTSIKTKAFTEADEAFFRMFQAFTGDRWISFVSDGADFMDLSAVMTRMRPGSVMFVEMQNHPGWWNYLKGSGFEYFPMMWRTYHIWRKPMRGLGASA